MRSLFALIVAAAVTFGTAGAASATTGAERFTIVGTGGPGRLVATGPITGVGTETDTHDPLHPDEPFSATFSLPQGDVFLTVTPSPESVVFRRAACLTQITQAQTFDVVGGTGAYQGASGSGTSTVHVLVVGGRDASGQCLGPSSPPLLVIDRINAQGTISVP